MPSLRAAMQRSEHPIWTGVASHSYGHLLVTTAYKWDYTLHLLVTTTDYKWDYTLHLLVTTAYKWDCTIYKCGYKYHCSPSLEIIVRIGGIIPKWPQDFRLVKYYNLPRYMDRIQIISRWEVHRMIFGVSFPTQTSIFSWSSQPRLMEGNQGYSQSLDGKMMEK